MEPWEKVLIKLGSKELAELDQHLGYVTCDGCHGGDPTEQDDADKAHEGLIADPSSVDADSCSMCHQETVQSYSESLHMNLWGEKYAVATRVGVDSFSECPQAMQDGFNGECGRCHATCGDCHVSRPDSSGKGFIKNHIFKKTPHQKNQCMGCHGSRIAHDFMGDDETGRKPDAHFGKGMNCMKCHGAAEMHSPATGVVDRYHYDLAPRCEDCHDIPEQNEYHSTHWDTVSCQVCHSQVYNNCAACHVADGWKDDPAYQENNPSENFRIGLNPFPDRRFKYVTVRHAPVAPSTYDNWGVEGALAAYDALPTWKYTTPHSVRRWTKRTSDPDGLGCAAACHLGAPYGTYENQGIYLFAGYVEENWPLEVEANSVIFVDDELPEGWKSAQ